MPQIYSANAQRFNPPFSAPVPPRTGIRATDILRESSALHVPPCSAPVPPRPGIRATDILRESSALPVFLLRTSPSPTRNPCQRYTPRKLSASRLPASHQSLPYQESVPQIYFAKAQRSRPRTNPCSEYFPSNEGNYVSFPVCNFWRESFDIRLYVQSRSNWVTFLPTSLVLSMILWVAEVRNSR